jgi:hypothetical protein
MQRRRRFFWALIALNLLLAITLVARWTPGGGENAALAQVHRPADYIMIPGEVNGGSAAVVYILDTTNGMLGAMAYDDSSHTLQTMPPLDLSRVFEIGGGGPSRGVGGPPPVAPRK